MKAEDDGKFVVVNELAKHMGVNANTIARWAKGLGGEVMIRTVTGVGGGQRVRVISVGCMEAIRQAHALSKYVSLDESSEGQSTEKTTINLESALLHKIDDAANEAGLSRGAWINRELWKAVK